VCISHGGGAIAFLLDRFERVTRTRRWVPEQVRDAGFTSALRRLWFDSHVDGHAARELLVEAAGTERLVYGSNFGGWDSAHREAADPFIQSLTPNAERLLRLVPATTATGPKEVTA
jgi:aminocarboxymuconate-semialdehyde decarboxylase